MHPSFVPNAAPSAPAFRRILGPVVLPPDAIRAVPAPDARPRAAAARRARQGGFYRAASLVWLALAAASIWIAVLF